MLTEWKKTNEDGQDVFRRPAKHEMRVWTEVIQKTRRASKARTLRRKRVSAEKRWEDASKPTILTYFRFWGLNLMREWDELVPAVKKSGWEPGFSKFDFPTELAYVSLCMKNSQDTSRHPRRLKKPTYRKNSFYPPQRVGFEGTCWDAALIVMPGELELDNASICEVRFFSRLETYSKRAVAVDEGCFISRADGGLERKRQRFEWDSRQKGVQCQKRLTLITRGFDGQAQGA
jgi:hypothetical protein